MGLLNLIFIINMARRNWDPHTITDISPEECDIIRKRAENRAALKAEWVKLSTNPYRGAQGGGTLFDPAVQRYYSMKSVKWATFKPTPKNAAVAFMISIFPIGAMYWWFQTSKDAFEAKCRAGQIAYKDRDWKYI